MKLPVWLLKRLPIVRGLVRRLEDLHRFAHDPGRFDGNLNAVLRLHDCLPLPPALLRHRVSGSVNPEEFVHVGKRCFEDVNAAVRTIGLDPSGCRQVLDFGCGCGRTIRNFHHGRTAATHIHGCDIDAEAVAWCRENLQGFAFEVIPTAPPTAYAADQFDLIYAISVFTHLPEDLQLAWLAELRRILRPGGVLLATVHAPQLATGIPGVDTEALRQHGYTYVRGYGVDGLPDYYQGAFHAPEYVQRAWSQHLPVVAVRPKAMNGHQDVVLCQKPGPT
ncbi:MAG: class I SAM-dependent methyltransferase [Planctomycetes bacterium]|nr:class I SAM-dependent methyltransferase [Planctomycetota bacterium]